MHSNSEILDNTPGGDHSPGLGSFFQTESQANLNSTVDHTQKSAPKPVNIELTDQFYQNLSWAQGADFLNDKAPVA